MVRAIANPTHPSSHLTSLGTARVSFLVLHFPRRALYLYCPVPSPCPRLSPSPLSWQLCRGMNLSDESLRSSASALLLRKGWLQLPTILCGSALGYGGPAAGNEEPRACGASDSTLGTCRNGPACWVWGTGGDERGRAAPQEPVLAPAPCAGTPEALFAFRGGHAPTRASGGGGCGRRPPRAPGPSSPGLRSSCSARRPLPRPLHPPSHLPTPRKKIMLAGACTSQSLPVRCEQRAPAASPCRDPCRAALAATLLGESLLSA